MICLGLGLILILICLTLVFVDTFILAFKVKDYTIGTIFLVYSIIGFILLIIFIPLIIMAARVVVFR